MSSLQRGAIVAALLGSAGCNPDHVGELTRAVTRWNVTMGHRGEGFVAFRAHSDQNGDQSGECRDVVCHATVDDLATLRLTPIPTTGFRFSTWLGDPEHNLFCPGGVPDQDGTIALNITTNAACIAVFEAAPSTPTTPTTPGVSQAAGRK